MFFLRKFEVLCVLTSFLCVFGKAQETVNLKKVTLQDDKEHIWTSKSYPNPYPPDASEDLLIMVDKGYSITITIESLDLDGLLKHEDDKEKEKPDVLVMQPGGTSFKDDGEGKVFVFFLRSERKYAIHTNSVYFRFHVIGQNLNQKKGFKIRYKRVGEVVTTTTTDIPTTTAVTWPTPSGSESIYYSAYIQGKNQNEFNKSETLTSLKRAIANMAKQYCNFNGIVTTEPISEENVIINYLIECPNTWPENEICVNVRFAVPIIYEENSLWSGYQLNGDNLNIMWTKYANEDLKKSDLKIYDVPDNKFAFTKWVIICVVVLIVFLVALMVLRFVVQYYDNKTSRKKRMSDVGIMSQEPRGNKLSLTPHPYQTTPPLFEENDYPFNTYEPDDMISKKTYSSSMGNQNFSYIESEDDDDGDIDIYNKNFSNSGHNNLESINKVTDI